MKSDKLLDILENVDTNLIEEAAPGNVPTAKYSSKKRLVRECVLAACVFFVIGILSPAIVDIFENKGGYDSQEGVPEIALMYFQGALYECVDASEPLERLGLSSEITAEMTGKHVTYIEQGGPVEYQETASQTDKELFEYAPAPTRAVYVLRDGDNYMAMVFVRTYFPDDTEAYCDLAEVYRFYDIAGSEDIVSITETDWNHGKVIGTAIKDSESIKAFYEYTTDIKNFISMDNDAFQSIVFDGIPEEVQQEAHTAFADDLKVIRIKIKDGLCFYIKYYPSYGFIYSGQAMAYHQVTPEIKQWFENEMKIK